MSEQIQKKHESIKADYAQMHKDGMRHSVITARLAERYFMSPVSLENIVWGTGGYKSKQKERVGKEQKK